MKSEGIVFVPTIGFRPSGTRTLRERAETTKAGTRLVVQAAAAAPEGTEIRVEWERTGDPVTCRPDSRLLAPSRAPAHAPLDESVTATLVTASGRLEAITIAQRGYHMSHDAIGAIHEITFPPLPEDAGGAELRVSEGADEWRVPFTLERRGVVATPLTVEVEHGGIVVRATALVRRSDEVIVGLEVEAALQIRNVGAPLPTALAFISLREEDVRARRQEFRRVFSGPARPITLAFDRSDPVDEVGRLFSLDPPQQAAAGQPFVSRFSVVFEAPNGDAKVATLRVPFVDLNDFEHSVTADLRDTPLDLALGPHRFRVVSAEPHGADERRVQVEVTPSAASPRFLHPARMRTTPSDSFSWAGPPQDGAPVWMTTRVDDPPIVTFHGVVLRVEGPWRLELSLS
jgi:hypothetical protein